MTPHSLLRAVATVTIIGLLTVFPGAHPGTGAASAPVVTDIDQPSPPARSLLFNTRQASNVLQIFDGSTLSLVSTLPVTGGCGAIALSADKRMGYLGCGATNRIYEIDLSDPAAPVVTRSFPAGRVPVAVAATPDGTKVLAVNRHDGDLTIIHLDQGGATSRLAMPVCCAASVAVSKDSQTAYVSGAHWLREIDIPTLAVTAIIPLSSPEGIVGDGMALGPDGRKVYVGDGNAGYLVEVDRATRTARYQYGSSQHAAGVAVSSDGRRAYTAHSNTGNRVSVFDLHVFKPVAFVTAGGNYPSQVRLSDDDGCLVVRSEGWIDIFRTSDLVRVASILAGGGPGSVETNGVPSNLCAVRRPAVLSWTPSDLTYGEPLGVAQLNATSDVQGAFAYSPAAGALLAAGTHQMCATFTPADPSRYDGGTVCRDVTVHRANILLRVTGGIFEFDGQPHGVTVESSGPLGPVGPVSVSYRAAVDGAVSGEPPSALGTYDVTVSFAGDGNHNPATGTATIRIRDVCTVESGGLSTLFGGASNDTAYDVVLTTDGGLVITGLTRSIDLRVTAGAHQPQVGGDGDAYVAKFSSDGSLIFATYLGGNQYDAGKHLVALPQGRVAVIGDTLSANFSVTADAYQRQHSGGVDVFVTVLSASGAVEYSTLFGTPHNDHGNQITVSPTGDLVFTGATGGSLVTSPGAMQVPALKTTAFVGRLRTSVAGASGLQGLATIGGDDWDWARAVAVDVHGRVYVAGNTQSADFPVTANAAQTVSGGFCAVNWPDCGDAFVTVLSADFGTVLYSSYLGSASDTSIYDIKIDDAGGMYVAGRSYSGDLAFTPTRRFGDKHGFVAKLQPLGSGGVDYITFVPGVGRDLVLGPQGTVTAAIDTFRSEFTPTPGAPDMGPRAGNNENAPVVIDLDADGALVYGNFALPGISHGHVWGIVADAGGRQYIAGTSNSTAFPASSCGSDDRADGSDAFLATLPVRRVSPDVVWAPSSLSYGEPVGAAQLNASASTEGTFSYSPNAGAILVAGTHVLSLTFTPTDAARYFSVTRDVDVTVTPASLTITAPTLSKEYGTDNPLLSASIAGFVNGDDVSDLSGTLSASTTATVTSPVGSYPITASGVTSPNYEIAFVAGTLTVVDTTAPVIASVTPSETTLWAPNHRMVPITLFVTATDATGVVSCSVIGMSSNEPVNGTGDGDAAPDWAITGPLRVQLRAERSGTGSGRVYTIRVQCQDASDNASVASTTVTVPHSKK